MKKNDDSNKTIKASIFNLISVVLSLFISLITVSFLSNNMSTSDMGISTSFITLQTVLSYIITLSIYTSINKAMLDKKINIDIYFSTITLFTICSVFIFYLFYLIYSCYFNTFIGFDFTLMNILFITIILDNIGNYYLIKWTFKNEYLKSFLYNIVVSPFSQIASIIFVYYLTTNKYLGRIIGLKILPIILGIILLIVTLIKGKLKFNKEYLKYGIVISLPIVAHLLSQILLANSDLLMIKSMSGSDTAGIYSVAYTIGTIVYTVITCILKPWSPWVYRRLNEKDNKSIYDSSTLLIILFTIITLGVVTIVPEMVHLFLNKSYYDTIYLTGPISLGMYFIGIYTLFFDIEYFFGKGKLIAKYSIITAIINIMLNYWCIKNFGYVAAAYTTLFSYLLLTLLNYIGMKKINNNKYYNLKCIIIYSLILLVLCFSNLLFINNIIVRYAILIFYIIIIYFVNKEKINYFFKNINIKKIVIGR